MKVTRESIMEVLHTIPDPEMPISIVDLGLVEDVRLQPVKPPMSKIRSGGASAVASNGARQSVTIDLLPTFVGCPALDMIAGDVRAKVQAVPGVEDVNVNWIFDPPWTVDRITPAGRESLREHGVTVPDHGGRLHAPGHDSASLPGAVALRTSAIPCPFCGSTSTYLDSPFGPTRCRTIHYCQACKNSFEHLKRV